MVARMVPVSPSPASHSPLPPIFRNSCRSACTQQQVHSLLVGPSSV